MTQAPSPRRALLVIDVQNEYVTGGLRIEHPPVASSLAAIAVAMDEAARRDIPVVVVQNSAPASSPLFAKGSPSWELHDVVARRGHDLLVEKTLPSAFARTGLATELERLGVDTLTIAGYMTHNCDASTALDALHRGYAVEFLHDAAGSLSYRNEAGAASAEEIHRAFSVVLQSRFAAVLSTAEWVEALASGVPPKRSSILASVQAARP
jgi:nicotinamidase-related amidase